MYQVAEIELTYTSRVATVERPKVTNSKMAYEVFLRHWEKQKMELQEQLYALYLDMDGRALAIFPASAGGLRGTVVDPRLIFAAALRLKATSVLLAHNHPSGNLEPSHEDKKTTEKLKKGGALLEITVVDHLIITCGGYYSMAENGDM